MRFADRLLTVVFALAGAAALLFLCLFLLGFRPFIIQSQSMEPLYAKGSLCWVNTNVTPDSVKAGDVLVYRSSTGLLVMHRLISASPADASSVSAVFQGDANSTAETVVLSPVNLVGKAAFSVPRLGTAVDRMLSGSAVWFLIVLFVILACLPWHHTGKKGSA